MATPALPDVTTLTSLPAASQAQVLDTLFESSPELHALMTPLLTHQSFSSYPSLIDAVGARLSALSAADSPRDSEVLQGILGSHPRLGESSPATKAHMSELSRREQANLNASGGGEAAEEAALEQAERLRNLNREYEDRFPGLRYVVFVNGRGRDVIMQDMRRRIDRGNMQLEIEETIQAMCDIAKDRARKLPTS